MNTEYRTIIVAIDPESDYHESKGTGSLVDLIEERNGEETLIRVVRIQ
jgi:hypothetical protein